MAYLKSNGLHGYAEFVRSHGGDPIRLMEEAGIDPALLSTGDGFYSFAKSNVLLEITADTLDMPDFGLRRALNIVPDFTELGPVVYLAYFEKTARGWVDAALRYLSNHTDGQTIVLIEPENGIGDAKFRLELVDFLIRPRQGVEFQMASLALLARQVLNTSEARPRVTRFQHARPANIELHQRIFGDAIEFGCEHDEFLFDPRLLEHKLNGNAGFMRQLIGIYMRTRMRLLPQFDLSTKSSIELYLQSVLGAGVASLEAASEAMSVSPKKLQRMLANEDTSFVAVLDEVRRHKAMQMLRYRQIKVARIAGLLDYGSTPAFTLAFRRWADMSPSDYRQLLAENNELLWYE